MLCWLKTTEALNNVLNNFKALVGITIKIIYCMRKYFFFFFLITNIICFGQDRKVELEIIGGKIYSELYIRSRQPNDKMVTFAGEAISDSLWIFTIPDSVVNKSTDFTFRGRGQTATENRIGFLGIIQGDTLIGREIHFEKDEKIIRLKVEYHHTTHEINYQYIPELKKTVALLPISAIAAHSFRR